jgi:crotonobetainyl-CoA:carnitine CoA-transferase CaiB-like acyl-CoA transferase
MIAACLHGSPRGSHGFGWAPGEGRSAQSGRAVDARRRAETIRVVGVARVVKSNSEMRPPLEGIRVVDVTTARGEFAGRVLADLGADVVKVEPPGGAEARHRGPFIAGREGDSEGSLFWAAVGRGKRSVVANLDEPADAAKVRALVAHADVFLESFEPGRLQDAGLDPAALCRDFPTLIYASITPFGQDGPFAQAPASDLTLEASSSLLGLQGPGDRPPVPIGYPQASSHAGVQAAADVCCALFERRRSGRGQHLDVSTQAAMLWTTLNATGFALYANEDPPGTGAARTAPRPEILPGVQMPMRLACADGHTVMILPVPGIGERTLDVVLRRAEAAGLLSPGLSGRDWSHYIGDYVGGRIDAATLQGGFDAAEAFIGRCTKRELQALAVAERVMLAPIFDLAELAEDPQLAARTYWTDVEGRRHCGPFARPAVTPLRITPPAPALGADQARLDAPSWIARRATATDSRGESADGIFAGLKVADFSWAATGPLMAKALADHGATVVRVESTSKIDSARSSPPYKDGERHIERAFMFTDYNTSKLGLSLDLSTAEGASAARRLIDWADVYIESFTPGTIDRFGLDWESVSRDRTDLVMVSTSMRGQTGPERRYAGFGSQGAALTGFEFITGWPDLPPSQIYGAYTDFIATRYGLATLASALYWREETGQGQRIDLAQSEAALHFLEPLILDHAVNGRVAGRDGAGSHHACPNGVFRCRGQERYVAISVETAEQWAALREQAPLDRFDADSLRGLAGRRRERVAIETVLSTWCEEQDAFDLAERLRRSGVPAYVVMRPLDLLDDPQLLDRGFFTTVDHAEMGPVLQDGLVTRYSRTPARLRSAAPTLGQHTEYVLRALLGYGEEEITNLALAGALS